MCWILTFILLRSTDKIYIIPKVLYRYSLRFTRIDFFINVVATVVQTVLGIQFFQFFPTYTKPILWIINLFDFFSRNIQTISFNFILKPCTWTTLFTTNLSKCIISNLIFILKTILSINRIQRFIFNLEVWTTLTEYNNRIYNISPTILYVILWSTTFP